MSRLDKSKQEKLEPQRMAHAKKQIELMGFVVFEFDKSTLIFQFKDHDVKYHAYSGWASGKSIKDGRGLSNLINQLK